MAVGIFISGVAVGVLLGVVLASRYVNKWRDEEDQQKTQRDPAVPREEDSFIKRSHKTMWDE